MYLEVCCKTHGEQQNGLLAMSYIWPKYIQWERLEKLKDQYLNFIIRNQWPQILLSE